MAHKFLRDTGEFAFPTPADIGVSTTTSTGLLSFLTKVSTADLALSSTATTFAGPSVSQGTTGVWLVTANWTHVDSATTATVSAKLSDGTTILASGTSRVGAATARANGAITGIITNPAGNITLSFVCNSATSSINFNFTGYSNDTALTAVRIG